ncbi:hypothetical protein TorRG33x02_175070 [Trema orientale]|uniref:Uncharacterized protein n=1 Tax=Trema orientale TaxID=63057 RepID=A0A2P5EMH8_TREOI|nr:hypothetical protein TorRG33x02_175070 [Trema orientale]
MQFQASLSASISLVTGSQSTPPRINEPEIVGEMLDLRRGFRRGVNRKLKRVASTSSTTTFQSQEPIVPDAELRDIFSQTFGIPDEHSTTCCSEYSFYAPAAFVAYDGLTLRSSSSSLA